MSKPITIAVSGTPLGVVVSQDDKYRFMAVKLDVWPLEGRVFDSVDAATRAAAELLARPRREWDEVEGLLVA